MKFWKKKPVKATRQVYNPPPDQIVIPDFDNLVREDAAIDYMNRSSDWKIDKDTGLIIGTNQHWSLIKGYYKLARGVKIRTTTGWPTDDLFYQIWEYDFGITMGLSGNGNLRFKANTEFRKSLLEYVDLKDLHLFRDVVLVGVTDLITEMEPAHFGIISGATILQFRKINYWDFDSPHFPCEELLLNGFYDFKYARELNEK